MLEGIKTVTLTDEAGVVAWTGELYFRAEGPDLYAVIGYSQLYFKKLGNVFKVLLKQSNGFSPLQFTDQKLGMITNDGEGYVEIEGVNFLLEVK